MNQKKNLLILIILLNITTNITVYANPSTLEWEQTFGGDLNDHSFDVKQTTDGGYIIAGLTWSYGAGKTDIYIIKTDSKGEPQWDLVFGASKIDGAFSVEQTKDKGFIICGTRESKDSRGVAAFLLKTDKNGNVE